jgi:hypothetical protein
MTLRQTLGQEAPRVHEQVEELLDSEDSIIVLVDGRRTINYARGFGLSACQLELLANDVERLIRAVTGAYMGRKGRNQREQRNGVDAGAGQRCDGPTSERHGRVAHKRSTGDQLGDHGNGTDHCRTGRVLRMASELAAPDVCDTAPAGRVRRNRA